MKYFWYVVIIIIGLVLGQGIIEKMSFSKKVPLQNDYNVKQNQLHLKK